MSTHFNPGRDWRMLLAFCAIAVAAIGAWNIWAFDTVSHGGTLGIARVSAPPVFSQSALDDIQTFFAKRAAEETKYQSGIYRYADPSQ